MENELRDNEVNCNTQSLRIDFTEDETEEEEKTSFHCDVCNKSFFLKDEQTIHKCFHAGEDLYRCDICGKSFSEKTFLYIVDPRRLPMRIQV
ncbi:zinc finger protein 32-like isoform X1 [Octopus sinensis]|uniref:Zinc finger protein 32-like isoform X1 n=1 Tax=Octopus sinensis TaxID=2607531 RepID=A0A7E6FRV6_9MOLL|nr:zinc finger protein 32-like isoform X1 [Octopus sinensis]